MNRVIAHIVIDPDEWHEDGDDRTSGGAVLWRRMVTAHPMPFSQQEVDEAEPFNGRQFFV